MSLISDFIEIQLYEEAKVMFPAKAGEKPDATDRRRESHVRRRAAAIAADLVAKTRPSEYPTKP